MTVVVDAGPVIHLSWLDKLDLLTVLFEDVRLPPAVRDEVLAAPDGTLGLAQIVAALNDGILRVGETRPAKYCAHNSGSR